MGGLEDEEPPSKRVKVSSVDGLRISLSSREKSCSLSDPMARLLVSQEDEVVGSKGIVKKVELVRIIADALSALGYSKTVAGLEEESGISLHTPVVELFMHQILEGQWDESVRMLKELGVKDETVKLASFVILEHKFFQHLNGENITDALKTLRTQIVPLGIKNERVQELSKFVLFPSKNSLDGISGQGSVLQSRKKLLDEVQQLLPPSVMIPEKRLIHLVEQALVLQKDACRFHNSSVRKMSLLSDHQCGREHIPSQTLQVLTHLFHYLWLVECKKKMAFCY